MAQRVYTIKNRKKRLAAQAAVLSTPRPIKSDERIRYVKEDYVENGDDYVEDEATA